MGFNSGFKGLILCNNLQLVHYVASTLLNCARFVRLHYSLLTYLGAGPFFRLPVIMSLTSSCFYRI